MKAIEYVEKYGEFLSELHRTNLDTVSAPELASITDRLESTMYEIFHDFRMEFMAIKNKRNVHTFSGCWSIAKELNDKWNAVINLMEKKYGIGVLQRNSFLNDFKAGRVMR